MADKIIKIYAATDIGTKEDNQDCAGYYSIEGSRMLQEKSAACEDVISASHDGCIAVVSDGVSQFRNSSEASETVVKAMMEQFSSFRLMNMNYVARSVHAANDWVHQQAEKNNGNDRAYAATMSALYLNEDLAIAVNVGDSPIFRLRGRELTLLSETDTKADQKMRDGLPKEKISESDKHTLTQCMGQWEITPHVRIETVEDHDIFIVMSDWTEDITLLKNRLLTYFDFNTGENPASMLIEYMHRKAEDQSYIDNSSIIILYVEETEAAS